MADNETIADVLAAMRDEGRTGESSCLEWVGAKMRHYADRLEAAHKREAAFHAMTCEANDRLREHLRIALDSNKRERGDAAKLREALVQVQKKINYLIGNLTVPNSLVANRMEINGIINAALAAPPRNCIAKVFVLVKADAFGDKMDQYEVFSSFKAANEWMRRDYISQQRKEEMADSMGVMKDDPAFFHDQPVPSSDSESAELFLGESHVVRWCIYEKELITEGGGDADK